MRKKYKWNSPNDKKIPKNIVVEVLSDLGRSWVITEDGKHFREDQSSYRYGIITMNIREIYFWRKA